jgi:putative transposon-encoded protein
MQQKKGCFDNSTIQLDYETNYAEIFFDNMISFVKKHEFILKEHINSEFNTSVTKIFDNLLMVYVKKNKKLFKTGYKNE